MNLLVVQTSFLGDTLLTTPVLTALHDQFPQAKISTLTTTHSAAFLGYDPLVQSALAFDKRGNDTGLRGLVAVAKRLKELKFDRAYGMQRSIRTSLLLAMAGIRERIGFREAKGAWLYHHTHSRRGYAHEVERNLAILGADTVSRSEQYPLRVVKPPLSALSSRIRDIVAARQRYVIMVPGSVWATKRWSIVHYRECARMIAERAVPVVLVGAANERSASAQLSNLPGVEDLCGQTTISDMVALVAQAAAVICNDSMALHLASAFQKPTVTLFCSTVPAFGFGPWQNPHARVLEVPDLPCRPCGRHGRMYCPMGSEHCMRGVKPLQVLDALMELGVLS